MNFYVNIKQTDKMNNTTECISILKKHKIMLLPFNFYQFTESIWSLKLWSVTFLSQFYIHLLLKKLKMLFVF